ncbi:MAG: hypothetical protein H7A51_13830 [Akkermansiaceae bacterium]|nr:hypothetical protein [Akkermansiaceae bacterium]
MKKAVGIIILILGVLFVVTFTIGEERHGSFKVPVKIKSDKLIVDAEYKLVDDDEGMDNDSIRWRDLDSNKWMGNSRTKDRYFAEIFYIKIGSKSLLAGETAKYICAKNLCVRLIFDDGSQLTLLIPLHIPNDERAIHIDATDKKSA